MCMYGDDGGWRVFRSITRRAAKAHRCSECGRGIEKGESYEYVTGLGFEFDNWYTNRTCAHCVEAKRWLIQVCEGYLYEAVWEDFYEHIGGHEDYIRSAPLVRLYRWQRADWRTPAGELRPIEQVRERTDMAISAYRKRFQEAVAA